MVFDLTPTHKRKQKQDVTLDGLKNRQKVAQATSAEKSYQNEL